MSQVSIFDSGKTTLVDFAGGANAVYVAEAKGIQPTFRFGAPTVSKANPAVFTSVAHGLATDNLVTIANATAGWAPLNGKRIVTVIDADTFSVAVDSSGFAGTFDGTVETTAPRTSASCWRISKNYYDGAGNVIRAALVNGSPADNQVYDSRATLNYQ